MKRIILFLLCAGLAFMLAGCGSGHAVDALIDDGEYQLAYDLVQAHPQRYGKDAAKAAYYLGCAKMEQGNYRGALVYFTDNTYKDAEKQYDACRYNIALSLEKKGAYAAARSYLKDNASPGAQALYEKLETFLAE